MQNNFFLVSMLLPHFNMMHINTKIGKKTPKLLNWDHSRNMRMQRVIHIWRSVLLKLDLYWRLKILIFQRLLSQFCLFFCFIWIYPWTLWYTILNHCIEYPSNTERWILTNKRKWCRNGSLSGNHFREINSSTQNALGCCFTPNPKTILWSDFKARSLKINFASLVLTAHHETICTETWDQISLMKTQKKNTMFSFREIFHWMQICHFTSGLSGNIQCLSPFLMWQMSVWRRKKQEANNTQGHKMSTYQPSESMTGQEQADLKNIA